MKSELTSKGEPRGYIQPAGLRELWFHTGTICNLSCSFCLEGSKPGDDRLQAMTLADVEPYVLDAVRLGVESFSFTGGEPFVIKDMVKILAFALQHRPCLVLTNGTRPLAQRMKEVECLRDLPHPVKFRISLDHPDAERHDAERGKGHFRMSLETMAALIERGFTVSVARQMAATEDREAMEAAYRTAFREAGLPDSLNLVPFPDFMTPGAQPTVPEISEDCMTRYQTAETRARFMCSYSKMVVKKEGRLRVFACTLVDDDDEYDQGGDLAASLAGRVILKHHRCFACFKFGSSCSEG